MYCALFIDQSVVLNRRRDGPVGEMSLEELEEEKREEELANFYLQVPEWSELTGKNINTGFEPGSRDT